MFVVIDSFAPQAQENVWKNQNLFLRRDRGHSLEITVTVLRMVILLLAIGFGKLLFATIQLLKTLQSFTLI